MTLILEIEYLSGVSFAAIDPGRVVPDWPPQPDRIFSALVATWAARGENDGEAKALKWLEKLPVPRIVASGAEPRTAADVFVPPNDASSKSQKTAKQVLPSLRSRKPRRFPAARPHDAIVRLLWNDTAKEEFFSALQQLASDVAYVGHSASLTRCHFLSGQSISDMEEAKLPERRIYAGRFEELCQNFREERRPLPGAYVKPEPDIKQKKVGIFSRRWFLFEHVAGDMPDIRACALAAKTLRNTLLSGYRKIGLGNDIPEVISGHAADGTPTRNPHLALAPLAFTGFPYADGHVMGFALVPPGDGTILDDENFRKVLRKLAPLDEDQGRRILTLWENAGTASGRGFSVKLSPTGEVHANKRSLDPALYTRPARSFATVTPIILDRHLKEKGAKRQQEIEAQITGACRNIGLPEPEVITADKHSAIEGAPSAYPSGKSPSWMRWQQPGPLASRQLTHAVIRFPHPVEGPVILGAGRFMGLGLCRPLDTER